MSGVASRAPVTDDRRAPLGRATAIALDQPSRRVALVLFGGIAVLCGLATLERLGVGGLYAFDFDGEGEPLAIWSALVLFAAGALGVLTGWVQRDRRARLGFGVFGAFLVFMGLDEGLTLHEHLQEVTDVDWLYLYAPLIVAGGVAWLMTLSRVWTLARERALLVAGAAAWFLAQVLETIEWDGPRHVDGYGALSGIEETLEVSGSALFVLAMLGALRAFAPRR